MKLLKQVMDVAAVLVGILVVGSALLTILMEVPFLSIPLEMLVLFVIHLLSGWYLFASEMFTRVDFHGAFWVKSMLWLLFVTVCLDLILRGVRKRKSKGTAGWRLKWSFGIAGMLMVLFGVSLSVHGAVVAMKWLGRYDLSAYRFNNLHAYELYRTGANYAERSQGKLPDKLTDLLDSSEGTSVQQHRLALAPTASVWEVPEYWTWLGGVPLDGPEDVPIAFAPRHHKRGSRIVLFRGGMTENCTEEEWQAALERWRKEVRSNEEQKVTEAAK